MKILSIAFTSIILTYALVGCSSEKKSSSKSIPQTFSKLASVSLHGGKAIGVSAASTGLNLADGSGGDAYALDADGKAIAKIFNIDDSDFRITGMRTVKDGSLIVMAYVYRYELVEVLEGGIERKEIAQFELPNGKRSLDDCLSVFRMQRDGSIDCAVVDTAAFDVLNGAYLDTAPLSSGDFVSDTAGNIYMFGYAAGAGKLYKVDSAGKVTMHADYNEGDLKLAGMTASAIVFSVDYSTTKLILADGSVKTIEGRVLDTFDSYIVTDKGLFDGAGEAIALTSAAEIDYSKFSRADLVGNTMRIFALTDIAYIDLAAKTIELQPVNEMLGVEAAKVVFLENDVYLAGYTGLYRVELSAGLNLTSGELAAVQIPDAPSIDAMVRVGNKVIFSGDLVTGSIEGSSVTVNTTESNIASIQAL